MNKILKSAFVGLSLLCLASCSTIPAGELSYQEIEEVVATFTDKGYTTVSYEGRMNLRNVNPGNYDISKTNQDLEGLSSFYLSLPLKIDTTNLEDSYDTILSRWVTTSSVDTVHTYKTDEGGLTFNVYSINKRLFINKFGIESSAKWNAEMVYDANGYLISESFETINRKGDSNLADCIFGECVYTYA